MSYLYQCTACHYRKLLEEPLSNEKSIKDCPRTSTVLKGLPCPCKFEVVGTGQASSLKAWSHSLQLGLGSPFSGP